MQPGLGTDNINGDFFFPASSLMEQLSGFKHKGDSSRKNLCGPHLLSVHFSCCTLTLSFLFGTETELRYRKTLIIRTPFRSED